MAVDAILYMRKSVDKMPLWVFFKNTSKKIFLFHYYYFYF
ncbi:hypothetical protein CsSME_00039509 [Camellia sinensis var. sinensis]